MAARRSSRAGARLDEAIKGTDFDRLDLMPADFSYRNLDFDLDSTKRPTDRIRRLIAPLKDEYDVVILDCPPSVSLVSENIVHACDVLLVPLIPAMLSVRTYDQLIDFVDGMPGRKPQVHGVPVDGRPPQEVPSRVRRAAPARSRVRGGRGDPESVGDRADGPERAPVPVFAPTSPAATAYEALWARVQSCLADAG